METAIFKYNGGMCTILCSDCLAVVKTGFDFTKEEWDSITGKHNLIPAQYCEQCKNYHNAEYQNIITESEDSEQGSLQESVEDIV